jgi:hypothetical protein
MVFMGGLVDWVALISFKSLTTSRMNIKDYQIQIPPELPGVLTAQLSVIYLAASNEEKQKAALQDAFIARDCFSEGGNLPSPCCEVAYSTTILLISCRLPDCILSR